MIILFDINFQKQDSSYAFISENKNINFHLNTIFIAVGDQESYESACKEVTKLVGDQGLNILFNNAGTLTWNTFETVTAEVMAKEFEVDCIGPVMITKVYSGVCP